MSAKAGSAKWQKSLTQWHETLSRMPAKVVIPLSRGIIILCGHEGRPPPQCRFRVCVVTLCGNMPPEAVKCQLRQSGYQPTKPRGCGKEDVKTANKLPPTHRTRWDGCRHPDDIECANVVVFDATETESCGNCRDTAVAESFFSVPKRERHRRRTYLKRDIARQDVFDCNEIIYNSKRMHARIGILSPIDFERQPKPSLKGV